MNFVYDARWLPMLSIQNATDRQAIEGGWVGWGGRGGRGAQRPVHPTRIAPSRTAHRLERGMVVAVAVGVMVTVMV